MKFRTNTLLLAAYFRGLGHFEKLDLNLAETAVTLQFSNASLVLEAVEQLVEIEAITVNYSSLENL